MPRPASASSTAWTVAARLPLKLRAMSPASSGAGEAARVDCTAPTCSGKVAGQGMTLLTGATATATAPKSSLVATGSR